MRKQTRVKTKAGLSPEQHLFQLMFLLTQQKFHYSSLSRTIVLALFEEGKQTQKLKHQQLTHQS